MQTINTRSVTDPDSLRGLTRNAYYNGLDCLLTLEIHHKLQEQLTPTTNSTYQFMFQLQGPVLDMMLTGTPIDTVARDRMITILTAQSTYLASLLNRFTTPLWGKGLNAGSWQQKAAFLYSFLGNEPIQIYDRTSSGMRDTTNRDALEKLKQIDPRSRPIVNTILAYQDCRKALGILKSGIDSDGKMRSSYNIAGTETGRLASRQNAFGTGCFPKGAEVLTRNGWQEISTIQSGTEICQSTADGLFSWAPATPIAIPYTDNLTTVKTEQLNLAVTADHRVLIQKRHSNIREIQPAMSLKNLYEFYVPLGGHFTTSSTIASWIPPIVIALIADGSNDYGQYWRIALKKSRKIFRLTQLAKEANIPLTAISAPRGYQRFSLTTPKDWPKDFGPWVLTLSTENANVLLDEMALWDGNARGNSIIVHTARYERAKWIQTLAHIADRSATITEWDQSINSYSRTHMYKVNIKTRKTAHIISHLHLGHSPFSGTVYCVTVPTGLFLVRYNEKIHITGNSNDQNWREGWRIIFIAASGPLPNRDKYNIPPQFRSLPPIQD